MKKILLLIATLTLLIGCTTDDSVRQEETEVTGNRDYYFKIGTKVYDPGRDLSAHSDPRGSIILKDANGDSVIAKNRIVSIAGVISYIAKMENGQVINRSHPVSEILETDSSGDFEMWIRIFDSARITDITGINLILSSQRGGKNFSKNISYTNETLWDQFSGLASALFDYDIDEHYWRTISIPGGTSYIQKHYDINSDVVLEEVN